MGLGAAFVSLSAIKRLQMNVHCAIEGVVVKRTLWLIFNRYRSKAAEAFSQEILPKFATPDGARKCWSRHRYKQMI